MGQTPWRNGLQGLGGDSAALQAARTSERAEARRSQRQIMTDPKKLERASARREDRLRTGMYK